MLKNLLFKLGAEPQQSWARFKLGLLLFMVGAVGLVAGAHVWMWLQIPAIISLTIGFLIAGRGYIGLFANRFAHVLSQLSHKPGQGNSDKQK